MQIAESFRALGEEAQAAWIVDIEVRLTFIDLEAFVHVLFVQVIEEIGRFGRQELELQGTAGFAGPVDVAVMYCLVAEDNGFTGRRIHRNMIVPELFDEVDEVIGLVPMTDERKQLVALGHQLQCPILFIGILQGHPHCQAGVL